MPLAFLPHTVHLRTWKNTVGRWWPCILYISARQLPADGVCVHIQGRIKERWLELCQRALTEKELDSFVVIRQELVQLLDQKTQRLSKTSHAVLKCALCNKPVQVENCKTDAEGRAVHDECYVAKVVHERGTSSS